MVLGQLDNHMQKLKVGPNLIPYVNKNSKCHRHKWKSKEYKTLGRKDTSKFSRPWVR